MALAHIGKGEPDRAKAEAGLMDGSLRDYKARVKMPVPEALKVARRELDGGVRATAEGAEERDVRDDRHSQQRRPKPKPVQGRGFGLVHFLIFPSLSAIRPGCR